MRFHIFKIGISYECIFALKSTMARNVPVGGGRHLYVVPVALLGLNHPTS
jgi:hypothetical protein